METLQSSIVKLEELIVEKETTALAEAATYKETIAQLRSQTKNAGQDVSCSRHGVMPQRLTQIASRATTGTQTARTETRGDVGHHTETASALVFRVTYSQGQ